MPTVDTARLGRGALHKRACAADWRSCGAGPCTKTARATVLPAARNDPCREEHSANSLFHCARTGKKGVGKSHTHSAVLLMPQCVYMVVFGWATRTVARVRYWLQMIAHFAVQGAL